MTPTIAIIGALEKEVRHIYDALERGTAAAEAGLTIVGGRYHGFDIVSCVAGMGTVNAAAATQHLISAHGANAVIFSGIAGSLNRGLDVGDVVIGERLRYLDTDTALIAESTPGLQEFVSTDFLIDLAEEALRAHGYVDAAATGDELVRLCAAAASSPFNRGSARTPRYLRGTIATGDRYVCEPAAKHAAIEATAGDCVEMEGAAVAHITAKNGVDCLVLRAISDTCDESYENLSARTFDLEAYAHDASALVLSIIRRLSARMGLDEQEKTVSGA